MPRFEVASRERKISPEPIRHPSNASAAPAAPGSPSCSRQSQSPSPSLRSRARRFPKQPALVSGRSRFASLRYWKPFRSYRCSAASRWLLSVRWCTTSYKFLGWNKLLQMHSSWFWNHNISTIYYYFYKIPKVIRPYCRLLACQRLFSNQNHFWVTEVPKPISNQVCLLCLLFFF